VLGTPRWVLPAAVIVNALVLWHFHDQHWLAVDEGNYAHIAERLLRGDVLHRDIQDLHPGYVNFVNAAAFALFGVDLVSLRYPLVLVAIAQSLLVWAMFVRRDVWLAAAASLTVTMLGVVQFLNPTAHWYALFVTICLAGWLTWVPEAHPFRLPGAGALLGAVAMFRQLTGVWVAMAVLLLVLREHSSDARGSDTLVARSLIAVMIGALAWYLLFAGGPEAGGALLLGSWPLAILGTALATLRVPNRAALRVTGGLAAGALAAVAPLGLYHAWHGSLGPWVDDVVFASIGLTQLALFSDAWFAILPLAALVQIVSSLNAIGILNGLYWLVLPLAATVNGVVLLRRWRVSRPADLVLPVVAAFYALVTLHLAGAVYLSYTVGLSAIAVLWSASGGSAIARRACAFAAAGVCAVAAVFHAAQSPYRTPAEMLRGERTVTASTATCPPAPRSSLRIELPECAPYRDLVQAVHMEAPPGTPIFAVPSDAELYFLADRPNPFRFYNSALGIRTQADLDVVLETLRRQPPRVVTYRPDDKYNTPASRRIMESVNATYERYDTIAGVELYRPRRAAHPHHSQD
jgi:hypothetical protein